MCRYEKEFWKLPLWTDLGDKWKKNIQRLKMSRTIKHIDGIARINFETDANTISSKVPMSQITQL